MCFQIQPFVAYCWYLFFEFMSDEFIHEKYGYGKEGRTNFRNLLRLCIALHDFNFVNEIWENMKPEEKKLWQNTPCVIPELLDHFHLLQQHKIYSKQENYCELLKEIGLIVPFCT